MSRVTTANRCNDRHEVHVGGQVMTYLCTRETGHRGYHKVAGVEWGRLWGRKDPTLPPPGRTGATSSAPRRVAETAGPSPG